MKKFNKLLSMLVALVMLLTCVPMVEATNETNSEAEELVQEFIDLTGQWNNHVSYHGAYYDHGQSTTSDTAEADDKNVGYHKDHILVSGADGNYTATNGIKDYTVKGVVDPNGTGNTVLTKNGIKFDLTKIVTTNPGLTGDPDSIRIKGSGKTIPVNGVFGKIHFAASARSVINSPVELDVYHNGIKDYEVTVNYTNGTKDTQYVDILGAGYGNQFMEVDSSKITDTVKYAFKVKDDKTLPENFLLWSKGCMVYENNTSTSVGNDFSLWYYTVNADSSKTVESVTFKAKEGTYDTDISNENANDLLPSNEILLFAMTGEKPVMLEDKTKATVVYLGGSITELGAGEMFDKDGNTTTDEAKAVSKGWCKMITDYLSDKYTGTKFTEINAGWGGTGSEYGYMRLYDDCLKYNPDIVFIEFAYNDKSIYGGYDVSGKTAIKKNLETIIRRIQAQNPAAKICFVYTTSAGTDSFVKGENDNFDEVADYYGIDVIDFYTYLSGLDVSTNTDIFPNGSRGDLYKDGVHPNQHGHKVYGDFAIAQLKSGNVKLNVPNNIKANFFAEDVVGYTPKRTQLATTGVDGLTLNGTWSETSYTAYDTGINGNRKCIKGTSGSSLEYEFTGAYFAFKSLTFQDGTEKFDIKIDGKVVGSHYSKGTNGVPTVWEVKNLGKGTHKLTIDVPEDGAVYLEHFYTDVASGNPNLNSLHKSDANQEFIDLTGQWNNHVSYHGIYYDHGQSTTSDTADADDKNVGYHKDHILVSGNDGNYTATTGIKDYTVKGVVDPDGTGNTVLTKNGIKFDLTKIVTTNPGLTGDPDSIRIKGSGKTISVNGNYEKIHFAASARSVINSPVELAVYKNGIKDYEVTVNYTNGTKDTQYVDILGAGYGNQFMEVDSSKITDTVKYAFKVKDGKTLPENFLLWSKGCMVYQNTSTSVGNDFSLWYYTVNADSSKTVESVTFKAKEGTYDTDISNENANDLLPSNEILLFAMTGEKSAAVPQTTFNIQQYCNALAVAKTGVQNTMPHGSFDQFVGYGGLVNLAYMEKNILDANYQTVSDGIKYDMSQFKHPYNRAIYVGNASNHTKTLGDINAYYQKISFVAGRQSSTSGVDKLPVTVNYTDGTNVSEVFTITDGKILCGNSDIGQIYNWNIGSTSDSNDGYIIYTHTLDVDPTKEIASITFGTDNSEEVSNVSAWIFAVTGVDANNYELSNAKLYTTDYKNIDNVADFAGQKVSLDFTVKSDVAKASTLLVTFYENKRLLKVESIDLKVNAGINEVSKEITIPEDISSNYEIKCMVWEGLTKLKPLFLTNTLK